MIFTTLGPRRQFTRLFKRQRIVLIICLVLFASPLASIVRTASAVRAPGLSLDSSSLGSCPNTTSSCAATINPQHAGDIIIVFTIESLNVQASACGFSVSDTANLLWAPRSTIIFDQTGRSEMQEFWAKSAASLTSDTVTELITGCGNNYNTLLAFAISGADFNSPFDPNPSLPASAIGNSGNTAVQISTSDPKDMIFAGLVHGTLTIPTAGPGFTFITPPAADTSEYEIVKPPVTNMAVTFGDASPANWISIADAVHH